jgi:hypothetical protein
MYTEGNNHNEIILSTKSTVNNNLLHAAVFFKEASMASFNLYYNTVVNMFSYYGKSGIDQITNI